MEDKVSNTISIIGIPKTATMEQVIIAEKQLCVNNGVGIDSHGLTFNTH